MVDFPTGTFLAPLLKMHDEAYGTIGGMKDGSKHKSDCVVMPAFGDLTSRYDLVSGGMKTELWDSNKVSTLKNKHYAVGLAATHFINMYLKSLENPPEETAKFFVDPSSEADEDSVEIIYFDNWVLYQKRIKPCDYVVKTRADLDQHIREIVEQCIETLQVREDTKSSEEELERIMKSWVEFSDKYFEEADEVRVAFFGKDTNKSETSDRSHLRDRFPRTEKSSTSYSPLNASFARAGTGVELSHIVDHETEESLCGIKSAEVFNGKGWEYDGPVMAKGTAVCPKCSAHLPEDRARVFLRREDFLDTKTGSGCSSRRGSSSGSTFPAYYVGDAESPLAKPHVALRKDDKALCGASAMDIIGREEWDYVEFQLHYCERCQEVLESGGFSEEEHESVAPVRWGKYPSGVQIHLFSDTYEDGVCGSRSPAGGWNEVGSSSGLKICRKCVLEAAAKDLTFPEGFADKIAEILEEGK